MKLKAFLISLTLAWSICSQAQTCQQYEDQITTIKTSIKNLDAKVQENQENFVKAEKFVDLALKEVARTGKPLKVGITIASGVISIFTGIFSFKMFQQVSYGAGIETEFSLAVISGFISLTTGAVAVDGTYNFFASRSALKKTKKVQQKYAVQLEKQIKSLKEKNKNLKSIEKVFSKLCEQK